MHCEKVKWTELEASVPADEQKYIVEYISCVVQIISPTCAMLWTNRATEPHSTICFCLSSGRQTKWVFMRSRFLSRHKTRAQGDEQSIAP